MALSLSVLIWKVGVMTVSLGAVHSVEFPAIMAMWALRWLNSIHMRQVWWRLAFQTLTVSHSVVSDSCCPMHCSPPGSSVRGILQARILEWVAISFSRRSSPPRDWSCVSCIAGRFFIVWADRKAQYKLPIPLLLIYPREMKTYVNVESCLQVYIIASKWKQPKYPSTEEWL